MAVTQKQLAAHFGCKQPYISKLVKRGMPLDSIEAAEAWRDQHVQRGAVGSQSTSVKDAPVEPVSVPEIQPGGALVVNGYDHERGQLMLTECEELRATVVFLREQIHAAKTANERTTAVKNYTAALGQLRQMEKELPGLLKAQQAVLDRNGMTFAITEGLATFHREMYGLGSRLSHKIVGVKDVHALQDALEPEIDKVMTRLGLAFEDALKPMEELTNA